jgi:hypothetical protein
MSYEGYTQNICPNGHQFITSPYYGESKCPICGEGAGWSNEVDQTNGDEYGYIDLSQFSLVPEKVESEVETRQVWVESAGRFYEQAIVRKVIHSGVYRIPTEEETKAARTYTHNGVIKFCCG